MTNSTGTTADYYRLLGISPDATFEEIRAAYRAKVRLCHPDLVTDKGEDVRQAATEMTAQLNEAYECLRYLDGRASHDASRATNDSETRPSTGLLMVSPRTLRCDVAPGETVLLTLDVRTDSPRDGDGFQVRTGNRLVAAAFSVTARGANNARIEVRVDTSRLAAHRIHHIPIVVTWGRLTGASTLVVRTTVLREAGFAPPHPPEPASAPRGHWTRRSHQRVRDMIIISLAGIVVPLLMLVWVSGGVPAQAPANPALVAAICAGVVFATTWFLTSSRFLRQPDRLTRIGVVWGHFMRWSGWGLVAIGAVVLGIPAVAGVLTVIAVIAAPFLGLAVIAVITSMFDSNDR